MALVRTEPYSVGDIATLRGPRGSVCKITAPDGMGISIPSESGRVSLWLPQVGQWRIWWGDEEFAVLEVIAGQPDKDDPPSRTIPRIEAA